MTADLLAAMFGPSDGPWTGNEPCTQVDATDRHAWRELAEQYHPTEAVAERAAKKACEGCDKITACLTWALNNPDATGVYGAMSDAGRAELRDGAVA